jgi:hypothetical protein
MMDRVAKSPGSPDLPASFQQAAACPVAAELFCEAVKKNQIIRTGRPEDSKPCAGRVSRQSSYWIRRRNELFVGLGLSASGIPKIKTNKIRLFSVYGRSGG